MLPEMTFPMKAPILLRIPPVILQNPALQEIPVLPRIPRILPQSPQNGHQLNGKIGYAQAESDFLMRDA